VLDDAGVKNGMHTSDEELEAMEPVHAPCTDSELVVTLANGQKVVTALWWCPRLLDAPPEQHAKYEMSPFGLHWPDVDEDLRIEGMLVGSRTPRARQPEPA
jgi:hypothetical protein